MAYETYLPQVPTYWHRLFTYHLTYTYISASGLTICLTSTCACLRTGAGQTAQEVVASTWVGGHPRLLGRTGRKAGATQV